MLMGEYNHSLDAKGRFIVPAKLREQLGERFVVTKGLDQCLFAFPLDEWAKLEEKIQSLPLTDMRARKFSRHILAGASEMELDKQGRALLPSNLRTAAGLEKDIVLCGVGSRMEIWDKDKWSSYSLYDDMEEVAENLAGLGI